MATAMTPAARVVTKVALVTTFFVISGAGQALSGFVVDRVGARPVLFAALASFFLASVAAGLAQGFGALMLAAALAGVGNAPFHPADFTILNKRVSARNLGHAFSVHGITGNLGWAAAPVFSIGLASAFGGWRAAYWGTALVALAVLAAFGAVLSAPAASWGKTLPDAWPRLEQRLRDILEPVRASGRFDFIILDCPRSDSAVLDSLEVASKIALVTNQELATLRSSSRMAALLRQRYPEAHAVRDDRALFDYVNERKQRFLRNAPWLSTVSGLAIMITVLGFNLLGDGLRLFENPGMESRWRLVDVVAYNTGFVELAYTRQRE